MSNVIDDEEDSSLLSCETEDEIEDEVEDEVEHELKDERKELVGVAMESTEEKLDGEDKDDDKVEDEEEIKAVDVMFVDVGIWLRFGGCWGIVVGAPVVLSSDCAKVVLVKVLS
jgi:hypothetical protein